jgi:hypothetical protein
MSKRQMLETLLETHDYAIQEAGMEQIQIWMNRVSSALSAAGMIDEQKAWDDALAYSHFSVSEYSVEPSLVLHAESMKAILLGILDKVKRVEPSEELFSMEIVAGTRSYIERIAAQANSCYQQGWYDACAVMIRRLVEQLLIDCYEQHGMASKIQDADNRYYGLDHLIDSFLTESWHIPQHMRKYLPQLKDLKEIGDSAAHGRNITTKATLDRLSKAIFHTFQGLVHIAGFK